LEKYIDFYLFQSKDLPEGSTPLKTLSQEQISVLREGGSFKLVSSDGSANIIQLDMIVSSKSVLHVIDTLI
jgi:hypothetical protein